MQLGGQAGALLALELQAAQRRVGRAEVGDRPALRCRPR